MKSLLPPSLAILGGGAGALTGNPVAAGLGAGAGSAAGSLIVMDSDAREDKKLMVEALTSGDVNKLVESKLKNAKDEGFFDSILTEIYGVIKLCVIGCALWFIVPMIYSHWRAKRTERKWKQT
jgi:hypothetical protein